MPRLYISNDSYPELREISPRWEQHKTWLRAFGSAFGDWRFWVFTMAQSLHAMGWIALFYYLWKTYQLEGPTMKLVFGVFGLLALGLYMLMMMTWAGDLMRPHLRRVSTIASEACPRCGHRLTDQLANGMDPIHCQECGDSIDRIVFEPPYPIPRKDRAIRWPIITRSASFENSTKQ